MTICSSEIVGPFFNLICSNNIAFPYFYLQCRNREIVTRILVAEVCNIERIFLESFNGLQFFAFCIWNNDTRKISLKSFVFKYFVHISLATLKVYFQTIILEAPRHFRPRNKAGCETLSTLNFLTLSATRHFLPQSPLAKYLDNSGTETSPAPEKFPAPRHSSPIFTSTMHGQQHLKNDFAHTLHCKYRMIEIA